jgi:putative ABC transport system substrate-binding protein
MRRRQALILLGGTASALALLGVLPARAAEPDRKPPLIVAIRTGGGPRGRGITAVDQALRQGLQALGYVEGVTIAVEDRHVGGEPERLPALMAEIATLRPSVIVTSGIPATAAAKRAALPTPIVSITADPVGLGFVHSLARPGGTITGLSSAYSEGFSGKWLELIKEIAPGTQRVGYLWNRRNTASAAAWQTMLREAPRFGFELRSVPIEQPADLDRAFAALLEAAIAALIVDADPINTMHRSRIIDFAAAHRLIAVYPWREFVEDGGLMSYGASLADLHRRAAGYVDKILKGARPAELPVEQPTNFELVINLATAKALGLAAPPTLLARADEVIE